MLRADYFTFLREIVVLIQCLLLFLCGGNAKERLSFLGAFSEEGVILLELPVKYLQRVLAFLVGYAGHGLGKHFFAGGDVRLEFLIVPLFTRRSRIGVN